MTGVELKVFIECIDWDWTASVKCSLIVSLKPKNSDVWLFTCTFFSKTRIHDDPCTTID